MGDRKPYAPPTLPPKEDLLAPGAMEKKLSDIYGAHLLQKFAASWCRQRRSERAARLRVVIALSIELEKVRAVSEYATGFGEAAIESVIEGDWYMVAEWTAHLTFNEDENHERRGKYARLWAPFVEILRLELIRRSTH
jgi:hypothetical protein